MRYNDFDYVIIDNPPNLNVLSINSLLVSDIVIVPIQLSYLSMAGLEIIKEVSQKIKQTYNKNFDIWIVPNMYEKNVIVQNEILDKLKQNNIYKVMKPIPKRCAFISMSMDFGDLKYLDKETLRVLNQLKKEIKVWQKR
jgi:chromosome partitioning protein